jgi:hypothetical protein
MRGMGFNTMTLPAFLFGMLVATVYGTGFHLITGGSLGKLLFDIIFSWIGFWIGHFIASFSGWTLWSLGPLHLGLATITGIFGILLGNWLTMPKKVKKK